MTHYFQNDEGLEAQIEQMHQRYGPRFGKIAAAILLVYLGFYLYLAIEYKMTVIVAPLTMLIIFFSLFLVGDIRVNINIEFKDNRTCVIPDAPVAPTAPPSEDSDESQAGFRPTELPASFDTVAPTFSQESTDIMEEQYAALPLPLPAEDALLPPLPTEDALLPPLPAEDALLPPLPAEDALLPPLPAEEQPHED